MQSALAKVEGVQSARVSRPDSAEVTGTASAEEMIKAINGLAGGRYKASVR